MNDDTVAYRHACRNFSFLTAPMTDFDECALRTTLVDPIRGPLLRVAKQRAGGHLDHVLTVPHDNPDLDSKCVPECRACP